VTTIKGAVSRLMAIGKLRHLSTHVGRPASRCLGHSAPRGRRPSHVSVPERRTGNSVEERAPTISVMMQDASASADRSKAPKGIARAGALPSRPHQRLLSCLDLMPSKQCLWRVMMIQTPAAFAARLRAGYGNGCGGRATPERSAAVLSRRQLPICEGNAPGTDSQRQPGQKRRHHAI
jgi:hypothetical protein